jgi:toxin ParE1/3/4
MNLAVKSPVWDDPRRIGLRIADNDPQAADRFPSAAEESFEMLKQHPYIGRLRSFSRPGVRSWLVPGFKNYLIFYVPTGEDVQVLAVLHGAQDLPAALAQRLE